MHLNNNKNGGDPETEKAPECALFPHLRTAHAATAQRTENDASTRKNAAHDAILRHYSRMQLRPACTGQWVKN